MSYSVKNVNGCTKIFSFSFEKIDLSKEISLSLVAKQKESNLKGFRKGKAPLDLIKKFYGHQVETDALNRFVQKELFAAIDKEKVRVVGYPSFENMNYEEEKKAISFDAKVEIFPDFELKDTKKLSFTKEKVEVKEEEIEQIRKNYLNSKATLVEKKDATTLEKGHFAVLNFQGVTESGERPENMKGAEFLLEIGSGQFIPGFEDGMIGMKKGEKKNINVTFPSEYHHPDLKNAKVVFEVELLEIKEKQFPEFTEELAKELGYQSIEDFKKQNLDMLTQQKERQNKEKLQQDILEAIIKENEFDVPGILLAQQENHLREDMKRNLKQQGFNDDMVEDYFAKWAKELTAKAQFQVRSGLILDKLAKQFNVEVSESDFEAKIEETAKQAKIDKEKVREYYNSNKETKKNIMYSLREEKTFNKLMATLNIKNK